jgi:hypothetical protein
VLPRSAFSVKGSTGFRKWLFEGSTVRRIDFLLNKGRWAFDAEPRYTVGLLTATARPPAEGHRIEIAGVAESAGEFEAQAHRGGIALDPSALGPMLEVPLLRDQPAADLLAKLRGGHLFPYGSDERWACFSVYEFHETHDHHLWQEATEGLPLWKGESFDQYDPHGAGERVCPMTPEVMAKVRKSRPGAGSILVGTASVGERQEAVASELGHARVVYRRVTRATDSRTIIGCLIPPHVFIAYSGPYLAFTKGGNCERAACLAVMNSLPFDWQARRFVELSLSMTTLEGLHLPSLNDPTFQVLAEHGGRLSCVDERFAAFAESVGVEHGPLDPEQRERLLVEVDALVGRAWGLTVDDLEVIFADFTFDAVGQAYRERLRIRLKDLMLEAESRRAPPYGQRN